MKKPLPVRILPANPDLDQLRRQARELLEAYRRGDTSTLALVASYYVPPEVFALHDAQLVLARSYGYESWPKLKAFVDGVTVRRLMDAVRTGDASSAAAMLETRPELATMDAAEHDEHQALHEAVLARNPEMVRLLMRYGADPRKGVWPHREASSAYTIAKEREFDEIVAVIEEEEHRRPTTRWQGHDRGSPLPDGMAEAARSGDQDRIIAFLEADPSLRERNEYLLTPLHRAASFMWDRVVTWLLDHGADVNARIDGGPSPLELVGCGFGPGMHNLDEEQLALVASILRSRGAELTPRAAVAYGEVEIVRRMHAEGRLENRLPKNQGLRGLLQIAVIHNQPAMLKLLLDLGLDPDEPVRVGDTDEFRRGEPLLACMRTGRFEMAEILIERGASLTPWAAVALQKGDWLRAQHGAGTLENPIGDEGGLVSMAVKHEAPAMLELLLELGLDPNERVRLENIDEVVYSGGRPLHWCAGRGELQMAEVLLKHGADPNLHIYASGNPIWEAYRARDAAMIDLLKHHGAIVNPDIAGYLRDTQLARQLFEQEDNGRLPDGTVPAGKSVAEEILDPALSGGALEIVAMTLPRISWPRDDPRWFGPLGSAMCFWHHIPWIRSPKWNLDRASYLSSFRLTLERCDPNLRSNHLGHTLLHEAAAMGDWISGEEVVSFAAALLDAGAITTVRDRMLRSTPLGWACRWGRVELVQLLLARGADPVEPDAEPWATPLAWAKKSKSAAILEIVSKASASPR